jgi:enterochelin esterase-like enzyme
MKPIILSPVFREHSMRTIRRASRFVWTMGLSCCLQTLTGITASAQPAEGTPAPSNIGQSGYPRILPDNRVSFQVRAPNAGQVQINLGRNYDMKKDDSGVWTVTTAPQDPGFHYYSLVIDGVSVSDPASETFYGTGRMSSAIEIPETGVDFYTVKDVPHGDIRSKRYFSKVTSSWRRLYVYTPPGYDNDTNKKYPVLYIQHGGGEDETGWAVQGRTDIILDNLIAAGKAQPMLVVIANGNVSSPGGARGGGGGYSSAGMAGFADELLTNIVPFIERTYRVQADAKHRALAGLSMGGGQAFYVGLGHKDKFGSVGVFSTGLFGGISTAAARPFNAEEQIPGILTNAASFNDSLKVFFISVGEQDPRLESTKKAVADFKAHGLNVEFASFPGGHEWQVWRKSLHDFAQRIFKP